VKDLFIIRMKNAPTESAVAADERRFFRHRPRRQDQDIKPTPEEVEDKDNLELAASPSTSTAGLWPAAAVD